MISTVNIQHLESLNDRVFELTGVRVRETIPDRMLYEADEVVLVDLRRRSCRPRIGAGKVYPGDRVEAALSNFFTTANLHSPRELALREVAEDAASAGAPRSIRSASGRRRPHAGPRRVRSRGHSVCPPRLAVGQRLGADIDVLWVHPPGHKLSSREATSLAALKRLVIDPRRPLPGACNRRAWSTR